jgi:hypothetical protein
VARIIALGATLVTATAGSAVAGLDTGELPAAGFSHTSLVDGIVDPAVRTMPTPDSLVDVYAWLARSGWTDGAARDISGVGLDRSGPTVRTMPTPDSLVDVYAWLAKTRWADGGALGSPDIHLDVPGPMAVHTTYTLQPAEPGYRSGWQRNDGPVIFTVTTGTLTVVDDTCQTFDLVAGHSYIGSAGQILDVVLVPEKNPGVAAVGWFTTRLSPVEAAGPLAVEAPCEM